MEKTIRIHVVADPSGSKNRLLSSVADETPSPAAGVKLKGDKE